MKAAETPLMEPPDARTIAEVISRAGSAGYELGWTRMTGTGYCAAPIQLLRTGGAAARSGLVGTDSSGQAPLGVVARWGRVPWFTR